MKVKAAREALITYDRAITVTNRLTDANRRRVGGDKYQERLLWQRTGARRLTGVVESGFHPTHATYARNAKQRKVLAYFFDANVAGDSRKVGKQASK